jgi:hypothetical protein
LPPEVMRTIHPHDDYRLALVKGVYEQLVPPPASNAVETDLFAGIRGAVASRG